MYNTNHFDLLLREPFSRVTYLFNGITLGSFQTSREKQLKQSYLENVGREGTSKLNNH